MALSTTPTARAIRKEEPTMTEIEAYCDKMAREYIKAFDPEDVCTDVSYYAYFQGMEDAIMNLDKISQEIALPFTPSTPRYAEALRMIADRMMEAHDSMDWQDIAHLALDVIPRIMTKLN